MKYLFVKLEVQDGENRHTLKSVHEIPDDKGENEFGEEHASEFYGTSEKGEGDWYEFYGGSIAVRCTANTVITKDEYNVLKKYL